ncbi:MAG: DUF1993 family protein [Woeseiaceae bacterium]
MTTTLFDLSVGSYIQSLAGVAQVLAKGKKFAEAEGISLDEIVDSRLKEDMLPFRFQIQAVLHQSVDTIAALANGEFGPPSKLEPLDYAGLQGAVDDGLAMLKEVTPEAVNACAGKPVVFRMGEMEIPFTAENFVLSFALPNLYFHATTAYDMLRIKGVPLSKSDYLGAMRIGVA